MLKLKTLSGVFAALGCLTASFAVADENRDYRDFSHGGRIHEFGHIVVIYQENHSFDNLFGKWGKVGGEDTRGLSFADAAHTTQIRAAANGGAAYNCLLQNDVNLTSPSPLPTTCMDSAAAGGVSSINSAFANKPFAIESYIAPTDKTCDPINGSDVLKGQGVSGGCTRDLIHRYYSEQYQINGGKQNRYVTGSDAVGLSMGYYDTTTLPLYKYLHKHGAPNYVIADNFFQAAFGGSFLNHQWLIAAKTPVFANALNDASANDQHSTLDANLLPRSTPLYASPLGSAALDKALTQSCNPPAGRPAVQSGAVCGDYAINTVQPAYQPYFPGTAAAKLLPPLTYENIGDRLSAKGVDWAWYSGGWSNADGRVGALGWTNGSGPKCSDANAMSTATYPNCPDNLFQFHHQPFNYFAKYAPGTAARADHLLDQAEFVSAAKSGKLKQVSFIKPVGAENEHPGYASESNADEALVNLIDTIVSGPNGHDTLIIITYDEFGGAWDHVPPPPYNQDRYAPADQWGPGTRIPAILISKRLQHSGVDHVAHDTTSILKLIEERFRIAPLGSRDAKVQSLRSAFSTED